MPGLELIGPLAGKTQTPSTDPAAAAPESMGMFIVGDAMTIRHYSGPYPGWRWMCRAQGPLTENLKNWPTGDTSGYFDCREAAQAFFSAVRRHAVTMTQGLTIQDGRSEISLTDSTCSAERFWLNGEEVMRLHFDHLTDLEVTSCNTDAIWQYDAHPSSPAAGILAAYHTQNDVIYLAIARAASGAAEHLVMVYSDRHAPQPTIGEGLPCAEWIKTYEKSALSFPSGIAVVQWGRLSGAEAQWQEDPQQPANTLTQRLGANVAVPLPPPPIVAPRLGNVPAAYAVRMEPGTYAATYYELSTAEHGGFSCCAISRQGAAPFLPVVVGNAAGVVHGNLTMEQYAMLSVERDQLLMRLGPMGVMSGEMAALCQKYGQPAPAGLGIGRAGRVEGWDLMIQGDPAFSAQWAVQMGIAGLRLQGIEPSQEQIQAMAQQQQGVHEQLQASNQRREAVNAEIRSAAVPLVELARTATVQEIVAACAQHAPNVKAAAVFFQTIRWLKLAPGGPTFERVTEVTEKIVRAHWSVMTDEERQFEARGKEEKYVKDVVSDVYSANKVPEKGFFASLGRMLDKL